MPALWLFPTNGPFLLEERRRDLRPRKLTRKSHKIRNVLPQVLGAAPMAKEGRLPHGVKQGAAEVQLSVLPPVLGWAFGDPEEPSMLL